MATTRSHRPIQCLADLHRGEDAEIGVIAFDSIRARCPELGIRSGIVVHCDDSREWELVLRMEDGRELAIDRFHAAFIEARPVSRPY
jgi:hypothetical protein